MRATLHNKTIKSPYPIVLYKMYAILTYGSLLNKNEIDGMFANTEKIPVKIKGYRRHFAQKSTFRTGENEERGVLTVTPDKDSWCNGLLLIDISEAEYEEYKNRESGYTPETVPLKNIEAYPDYEIPHEISEVLIPIGDRPLENPNPIPSYTQLCVTGAEMWGQQFLTDFLVTTYKE